MPNPTKLSLTGMQSLVRSPDARVLLVQGEAEYAAAAAMFPANPILMWEGGENALGGYHGPFAGRDVIVWPAVPTDTVELVQRHAHVFRDARTVAAFQPADPMEALGVAEVATKRLPRTWMLSRLVTVALAAPEATVTAREAMVAEAAPKVGGAPAKAGKPVRPPRWTDLDLILSDRGIPVPTLDNAVRVIERDPALAGHLWYDSFLGRILTTWGRDAATEWTDADDLRLNLYLQRDVGIGKIAKGTAAGRRDALRQTGNPQLCSMTGWTDCSGMGFPIWITWPALGLALRLPNTTPPSAAT